MSHPFRVRRGRALMFVCVVGCEWEWTYLAGVCDLHVYGNVIYICRRLGKILQLRFGGVTSIKRAETHSHTGTMSRRPSLMFAKHTHSHTYTLMWEYSLRDGIGGRWITQTGAHANAYYCNRMCQYFILFATMTVIIVLGICILLQQCRECADGRMSAYLFLFILVVSHIKPRCYVLYANGAPVKCDN